MVWTIFTAVPESAAETLKTKHFMARIAVKVGVFSGIMVEIRFIPLQCFINQLTGPHLLKSLYY